jgi:hypothetical protein
MMCVTRPLAFYFARLTLYELVFGTDVPRCYTMSKNAAANGRHRDAMALVTGHAGGYRLVACRVKKQRLGGWPGAADFG